MSKTELWSIGEFANQAGVTIRTLRHYDRMGLLCPTSRTETAHRKYSARDLVRLQQILTLKFIGLPLKEIKLIIDAPAYDLTDALRKQQRIVEDKARRMKNIACAIEKALDSLSAQALDLGKFVEIIEVLQMEEKREWMKEYYSDEQLEKLAQREWTPEMQSEATREWEAIYAEAKRLSGENADPAGPQAQALAERMRSMIDQFTGGDPEMEASLNKMYANRSSMPAECQLGDEESNSFLGRVMEAHRNK